MSRRDWCDQHMRYCDGGPCSLEMIIAETEAESRDNDRRAAFAAGLALAVQRLRDVIAAKLKFGGAPSVNDLMDLADTLEREGRGG